MSVNSTDTVDTRRLKEIACQIRVEVLKAVHAAGYGHVGGNLSIAEILAVLYFRVVRVDPRNPGWPDRDRVFLSKGHTAAGMYTALALKGFFPLDELATIGKPGSRLQSHVDIKAPGVESPFGALGQGASVAVGMALGARMDGKPFRVYAILSDGEHEEGSTWEAVMSAAHYKLDHLTFIIDYNNVQLWKSVPEIMNIAPLAKKYEAFGWNTIEVDGHDPDALLAAFETAADNRGRPTAVIAKTIKGKGVSFMENQAAWHGKAPTSEELAKALAELGSASA